MEVSAQNVYNLIAQQHWYNYNKYVASVFQEIAQSDLLITQLNYLGLTLGLQAKDDVPERTITVPNNREKQIRYCYR